MRRVTTTPTSAPSRDADASRKTSTVSRKASEGVGAAVWRGVCAFLAAQSSLTWGAAASPAAGANATALMPATLLGRVPMRDGRAVLSWPQAQVRVIPSFDAPGCVEAEIFAGNSSRSVYSAEVDGATAAVFAVTPQQQRYLLACGLEPGDHDVRLTKRTPQSDGEDTLSGFVLPPGARLAVPPIQAGGLMRVIGDGVAAGTGLAGIAPCEANSNTTDSTRSFAALTARALGMDLELLAQPNKGMAFNAVAADPATMVLLADHATCDEGSPLWDGPSPNLTFVMLGQSDLRGAFDRNVFTDVYARYVRDLVHENPTAPIVVAIAPTVSLNATAHTGEASELALMGQALDTVVERVGQEGVYRFAFEHDAGSAGSGCDGYPNAQTHAQMARSLTQFLAQVLDVPTPAPTPTDVDVPLVQLRTDVPLADNFTAHTLTWADALGAPRSAALVPNTFRDARTGQYGGYVHAYNYTRVGPAADTQVTCVGATESHPGFGFLLNHYERNKTYDSTSSIKHPGGATRLLLEGDHHVVFELTASYPVDNTTVDSTVQWLFATGRHPVIAMTQDVSGASPNVLNADIRGPYGDIDCAPGQVIDGVEWGTDYHFRSLPNPNNTGTSLYTGWDNTQFNTVPFVASCGVTSDTEMGYVQTQTMQQHPAGGGDFAAAGGSRNLTGPMPQVWDYPMQINQYELGTDPTSTNPDDNNPASKRLAWGSNYGALGQTTYTTFDGRNMSGYPRESHSVYAVLGPRSQRMVAAQVADVEAAQHTQVIAERGLVVHTEGPAGAGRSDGAPSNRIAYAPPGYSPIFGTWDATANDTTLALRLQVEAGFTLTNPLVRIFNWTGSRQPATVRLDGRELLRNHLGGYFASRDVNDTLWLTVAHRIDAEQNGRIEVSAR